ncbi:SPOSA6832_03249, partial [Sporobolomyces salmonicolor]
MDATLPRRHQQLSAITRTKRLLYAGSLIGLLSLVGVCVAVLPWSLARSQAEWLAFAIVAACGFVWLMIPLVVMGSLGIPRRVHNTLWLLLEKQLMADLLIFQVACGAHIALAVYLEYQAALTADNWVSAILPIAGITLLILLHRSLPFLPQNPLYSTLADDDFPPDWHVPPAELAPDSSASESEGEGQGDDAAKGWYELGKHGARSKNMIGARGWSELRKERRVRSRQRSR